MTDPNAVRLYQLVQTAVAHATPFPSAWEFDCLEPVVDPGDLYREMKALVSAPPLFEVEAARSSKWPKVRAEHLEKYPACAACGSKIHLNVHHCKPFHLHPELELDPANLLTLCENPVSNHHYLFGHFQDWGLYNPRVREMAAEYLAAFEAARKDIP